MHTLISPIIVHKSYSVATPGHPMPLLLEYHVVIVALLADLQRFFFYSVIELPYYSSDTELIYS